MVDETAKVALVYDASGMASGAAVAVSSSQKILEAENKRAIEAERQAVRVVESLNRQMRAMDSLERRVDPLGAAVRSTTNDLDRLATIASGTGAAAERAATLIAAAQTRQAQATAALTQAHGQASQAFDKSTYAVRQFGIQSIDVFQGLATGAPIMTTFIQQGSQIAQTTAAAGVGMGQLARGVAGAVAAFAPFIAAAAVVAGIAAIGAASETTSRQILGLQNSLRATRTDYQALAADVQATAKVIAATTGIGSGDAREAGGILAGAANFSGGRDQLQALIKTANDLATVMGKTLPEASKDLAAAMEEPGKVAQRLANERFPGMSQALAYAIKLQADAGDRAGAFAKALGIIEAQTKGAAENLTPLQKAMEGLSKAFTTTGQDGRSLADAIGGAITGAAASAIDAIATVIGGIEKLRQAANAGGGSNAIPAAGGYAGTTGTVLTSSAGAMGIFQLMPGTAAQYRVDPTNPDQNILGGLSYIRDLYGKTGGNVPELLRQYGGFQTKDPSGYIASVNGADTSILNGRNVLVGSQTMTVTQAIEMWGQSLGLPRDVIDLGKRIAVVESGGRQYGSDASVSPLTIPTIGAAPNLNLAIGQAYQGQTIRDQAFAAALGANGLSTQRDANRAQQSLLTSGIAASSDPAEIAKMTEALAKLRGEESDLITEQEKLARSAADATKALSAQAGYARTMAEIDQKFAEAARAAGRAVDQQALAMTKAAKQVELATEFGDMIRATDQATEAQLRINLAYDGTAKSLERATNFEKAYAQARRDYDEKSPDFNRHVQDYADALNRASDAARSLQQAQESVQAISNTFGNAVDRLGQGLVDAFLSGSGAAVNFGNIAKSIIASIAADMVKLAIANPLKNALFGTTAPTLSAGLSALTGGGATDSAGGGGVGGLLNGASNLFSIGKLTDMLGLTNLGGQASSLLNSIGLTGNGGLFSGIGSSINNVLSTPIWGQANAGTAWLESMGITAGAPGTGAVSLGNILGPAGIGFGLGSFGGGLLQSALNKTGPGPTIGAGLGTAAGVALMPVLGPLGPIFGGLLGGAGGGLIGPKPASAFSSTGISLQDGQLKLGQTVSQIVDTSQEVANAASQLAQINQFLSSSGITITSLGALSQIGQNTPGGTADPSKFSDLNSAFGQFSFGAPNNAALNSALSGKTFSSMADVQAVVTQITTFTDQTMPALIALGKTDTTYGLGTLGDTIKNLTDQFTAAITQAQQLGIAEGELTDARDKALTAANDNAAKQIAAINGDLVQRAVTAEASNSGNAANIRDAALRGFDIQAQNQRQALEAQLLSVFGDGFKGTDGFAGQMAALERALGAERLAIVQQYNDQIATTEQQAAQQQAAEVAQQQGQAQQAALGLVTNIAQYVRGISTGAASPLSAQGQFDFASRQFDAAFGAARAGDFNSAQSLTSLADTKLTAARGLYGSGAGYVQAYNEVVTALEQFSGLPAERLTNSSLAAIQKAANQPVVDGLEAIRKGINDLRLELRQVSAGPPAERAA